MNKRSRYEALVAARKAYDPTPFGLSNPSSPQFRQFDSNEVGPWTRWANDLDADLMVVGQDWGDETYFVKNRGHDLRRNPTNSALRERLESVGRPIPPPPEDGEISNAKGVWLTNASLWLKKGGLSSPVREDWFREPAAEFLREQIDIVRPRVVVALGVAAYKAVAFAFGLNVLGGPFRKVVEDKEGIALPTSFECTLFGVYHCGTRVTRTLRSVDQQRKDWGKILRALRR